MKKDTYSKIKTIDELAQITSRLRKQAKKIVHCHGVFDLLHPGHIKYFEAAKKKGEVLIVTLTKDEHVNKGPGRPIFNQGLRAESIAAFECVDFVAINDWPTAVEAIKKLKPDFYVKGSDYADRNDDVTGKIYEEETAVKSIGGALCFTDEISFSSTSIINTFLAPYPEEARDFFQEFKKGHTAKDIINYLKMTEDTKVLVIGDIIIDEYCYCVGMGKSQKDNIIATKFLNEETFAGGVLAAANHLASFCKDVTLVSCIGLKNDYSSFIESHLKKNIKTKFYHLKDAPTVVKRRFVDPAFLNKLFELCYLEDGNHIPGSLEKEVCSWLNSNLKKFDMVLVADFGHGLITQKIVNILSKGAKFLAVNVQTNSANLGFNLITKFPHADYVCIDEPELRLAYHDRFSNLEKLILKVSQQLRCDRVIITMGHRGSLVYTTPLENPALKGGDEGGFSIPCLTGRQAPLGTPGFSPGGLHSKKEGFVQIPVFSKEVVDRIGAGDAYFSITSPCVFKNTPMDAAGFIGNAVGAMKVLIVGNRSSVEPVPLFKYVTTILK